MSFGQILRDYWKATLEIAILWLVIYYTWKSFRGTRGAKVLTGLAVTFLTVWLVAQFFQLQVIGWLLGYLSAFLVFALLIIFQPELRRALAALGTNRLFGSVTQSREAIEVLAQITFDLANRQLGALIAIEVDQNIDTFAETGVPLDCQLSPELVVSILFPKTPLHDGGIIVRNDRLIAAACVFPVSQRVDLDRTLGTRHRAALGLTEESDAVVIVVSEETGIVSICHRGSIERNFEPESFTRRLGEFLLLEKHEQAEKIAAGSLAREDRLAGAGRHVVGSHQKEHRNDHLAF
jgi:diadenylate cyclase